MAYLVTHSMIIGLPESTFFIVFSSFAFAACLLLIWAFTFKGDSNDD